MLSHLKLLIAKLKRALFDASSERGRKLLDQLEMQLEELETAAAEAGAAIELRKSLRTPTFNTRVRLISRIQQSPACGCSWLRKFCSLAALSSPVCSAATGNRPASTREDGRP